MSNFDDAKGKFKEAAGDVSGDENLKNEGKLDQATGKVKEAVDGIKDKLGSLLHKD